jgi:hypothetical protein
MHKHYPQLSIKLTLIVIAALILLGGITLYRNPASDGGCSIIRVGYPTDLLF